MRLSEGNVISGKVFRAGWTGKVFIAHIHTESGRKGLHLSVDFRGFRFVGWLAEEIELLRVINSSHLLK